jgi:YidC/Oxa1 family membrane protein insertase
MEKINDALKADPNGDDLRVKMQYQDKLKKLFVENKVNPLRALSLPIIQLPIFIVIFMSLKDMGNKFPGFSSGGALWFTDLSVPDPYFILPVLNAVSFLTMVEIGADGMQTPQQAKMKMVMRGLALLMVPLTYNMPQVRIFSK